MPLQDLVTCAAIGSFLGACAFLGWIAGGLVYLN
jgi:hypothetical protein